MELFISNFMDFLLLELDEQDPKSYAMEEQLILMLRDTNSVNSLPNSRLDFIRNSCKTSKIGKQLDVDRSKKKICPIGRSIIRGERISFERKTSHESDNVD